MPKIFIENFVAYIIDYDTSITCSVVDTKSDRYDDRKKHTHFEWKVLC